MNSKLKAMGMARSSNALDVGRDKDDMSLNSTEMFRGFVGGTAFITKKGYRGTSIDSIWVQNLFKSFDLDDAELAAIAIKSSLADIHDVVTGGEYGTPYSIGLHGFYAESQFQKQATLLKETERHNSDQKFYLSENEWGIIDHYLTKVAHVSKSEFDSVCPGDTFAVLAVKKNAYEVAAFLLHAGVDPVLPNDDEEDLFMVLKQQYQNVTIKMKELSVEMHTLQLENRIVRHVWDKMEKEEQVLIAALQGMLEFISVLRDNFERRLQKIEMDRKILRRAELLHQSVSPQVLWNIAQEDKILAHLQELPAFENFVTEKIFMYRQQQEKRKEQISGVRKKNKHVLMILAANNLTLQSSASRDPGDASSKLTGVGLESPSESGKFSTISTETTESAKLDRVIMNELLAMAGDSLGDSQKSKRNGKEHLAALDASAKESKFKPILGTLQKTGDTIINYR